MTDTNKTFYRSVFAITLPIALQNIISYSVNLMDTVMLGKLGEIAISSASLANQMFFIFTILCYGIGGGAMVLVSQYWGKRDILSIQKITTIAVKISFLASLVFTGLVFLFPEQIMGIFIGEAEVIQNGAAYLRVVCISYLFFSVTSAFLVILRSVETVKISVVIYSVSFVVNVFFNYIFIFGKFGAPALGVVGAAIGTVLARITEFIFMLIYMLKFDKKLKYRPKMLLWKDSKLFHDMLKYGLPVMLNELLWALSNSVHSVILGHIGSTVVAANSICNAIFQMAISFILGVANASAVVIGKVAGTNNFEEARQSAFRLLKVYTLIGALSALVLLFIKTPIISVYDIEPSTKELTQNLMIVYSAIIFFMSYSCPLLMGVFRGSGSTKFAMITDVGTAWIAVALGAAGAFCFHFEPVIVLLLLRSDTPVKTVISLLYLKGTSWIKNVTV